METTADTLTSDETNGRALVDRALADGAAIEWEDAAALHRAIGWPPPRLDADGAIRAPRADELARWASTDLAIVEGLGWTELGEEIEHRSPAIYAAALAAQRATAMALRVRDASGSGAVGDDAPDELAAPVTADELAAWDRVGRVLARYPASLRRVLAALSTVEPDPEHRR